MKQIPSADPNIKGGRALCVQDIESPISDVWSQILSFGSYVGKVPKLKTSEIYEQKELEEGNRKNIKVKMVIGVMPGYKYECYYDHVLHRDSKSLTWRLDYQKYSDFDDVSGHWNLDPLSDRRTRVYYACDLKMRGKVPGPVMNILSKKALKEATGWVKRESEKATKGRGAEAPEGAMPQA